MTNPHEPMYECDGCGACCRTKLVDVFDEDLLREPRLNEHMTKLREPGIDFEIGYLNCLRNGACPFLDDENRCSIYPTRPVACVVFPAGSEECQEARRTFDISPLLPTNSPQDSPDESPS